MGDASPQGEFEGTEETGSSLAVASANDSDVVAADLAAVMIMASNLSEGNVSEDGVEALLLMSGGWHQGGDKMWGSGTGVESINHRNVGYYNAGMYAARSRCGGAGCALIVNPPGHRTVQHFHIHFVHYHSYGAHLKRRLESKACGRSPLRWKGGLLPWLPWGLQQGHDWGRHPPRKRDRVASILWWTRHHRGVGLRLQHRASNPGGLQPQVPLSAVRARAFPHWHLHEFMLRRHMRSCEITLVAFIVQDFESQSGM